MSEADPPIIVAHRGLHTARRCENSMFAFMEAAEAGIPWAECDVWASADGVPVVIHDETLDRTTTGRGRVSDHLWEDLIRLHMRLPDGSAYTHDHPRSLAEVAGMVRYLGDDMGLLVEVKPPDAPALARDCIDALDGRCSRWMIQSFHEENLVHALACDIITPVAFLVEDRQALRRGVADGWKHIHLCHDLLDAPTTKMLRDHGVSIGVWTVNTPEDLGRVMDLRADMIITDEPLLATQMLRR